MVWKILMVVLPSLVVFLTAFLIIKHFLKSEREKQLLDLKHNAKQLITPLRLQAYERMALFLERIDLPRLVLKLNNPEITAGQLQALLISSIRSELEHNLSQQVYFSGDLWDRIKLAEEQTITLINLCVAKLPADAMSMDLAKLIIEESAKVEPTSEAMHFLKEEVRDFCF